LPVFPAHRKFLIYARDNPAGCVNGQRQLSFNRLFSAELSDDAALGGIHAR
jgi:hypothetical protein